jgi:putative membrane protein
MTMKLTADDKARIQAALAAAESHTHLHVAVSVVPASDRYLFYPLVWGVIAALTAGAVLAVGWPRFPLREAFAVEGVVFVVLSLLFDWWPLRIRMVPRAIRHHRAQALAHREFAARILASQERKGGVLLFISLGERYAEILADRETHARLGNATWEKILADFLAAVKNKPVADAIVGAIDACVAVL